MNAEIIPFPAPSKRDRDAVVTTLPFGGCPGCGSTDGYHWFVCHRHKTRWRAGSNFFSGWRDESEETWLRNRFKLAGYMWVVEPVMPIAPRR